jgi:hypothetical protein
VVATAPPSASLRERAPAVRHGDVVLWWTAFGVIGSAVVAYAVLPTHLNTLRNVVIYSGVELAASVCIVVGVIRFRPRGAWAWLAIAAGIFTWFVGDLLWGLYEMVGRDPFPSVADLFYVAGYPLIATGLGYAAWRRGRIVGAETGALLDALLVAVLASLLAWVYLIDPILDDTALSVGEKLVSIAYPIGDVLLVSFAARFVMGASWDVLALWLLASGLALTLVGDVVYASSILSGDGDRLWGTTLLAGLLCFALAGLSPTMRALTEERPGSATAPDSIRRALLGLACAIPPGVLAVQSLRDEPLYLWVTIIAMAAVSALVVIRFTWVTNRMRRAVTREAALRQYAAELLEADDEEELRAAATRTGSQLIGGGTIALVLPGQEPEGTAHGFSAPVDVGSGSLSSSPTAIRWLCIARRTRSRPWHRSSHSPSSARASSSRSARRRKRSPSRTPG